MRHRYRLQSSTMRQAIDKAPKCWDSSFNCRACLVAEPPFPHPLPMLFWQLRTKFRSSHVLTSSKQRVPPSVHADVLKRTHNNEMGPKGRRANNFTPEHLKDGLLVSYTKYQATVQTVWSVGAPSKYCKVCSMYMFKEVTATSITPVLHQEGKKKKKKLVVTFRRSHVSLKKKKNMFYYLH